MKLCLYTIAITALLFSCQNADSVSDSVTIENELFSKQISCNKSKASKIEVSIFDKQNETTISSAETIPFFEFCINKTLVTSRQKLWMFRKKDERKMGNTGTEFTLLFEGVKAPVKGLLVEVRQQIFPGSTLIREKLTLKSDKEVFQLNKLDGKLHFVFPGYSVLNAGDKSVKSAEIRMASWEKKPVTFGDKKKGNHMYYPDVIQSELTTEQKTVKGPVSILTNGQMSWLTAYEHASQDDLNGLFNEEKLGSGNLINDAMQGTKGVFNFPIEEEDFRFLGISAKTGEGKIDVSVDILRGGYLEGEVIDRNHPYSTVWTATGYYKGENLEDGKAILRNYLFNQICEKPASRAPEFYYNTWGMQREDKRKPLRGILTYERIFEEIEYAAELGVDIFVLDDGWENAQGEWFPNEARLTKGLAPIKEKLDEHGIKMGLWYSPMGIDSTTERYRNHPDWVIKDSNGDPITAQWGHPAFDFVGGFFDVFVEDCKKMIDQGCRFMKWDAINTFYSSLPNLDHGSDNYSKEELRARYEYLLPIYVVRAMEILTDYEPELVIEMDLTEARRVMVGLAPLSQGKLFWMNNGASWYNDYSTYRTQSMRTIANEFSGIIPFELFTYANYPHNIKGAMKYNSNNSLLAGHGFWGNLQLMSTKEREWIGSQVELSKKVLPHLINVNPIVSGKVGDSPEIYSIVNSEAGAGQIIAFTEEKAEKKVQVDVRRNKILAVLNNPYAINGNRLTVRFVLKESDSEAVFILPNHGNGISIQSSSSAIINAGMEKGKLKYELSDVGFQKITWSKKNGKPEVQNSNGVSVQLNELENHYELNIEVKKKNQLIVIQSS